jgi:hypothetical protein
MRRYILTIWIEYFIKQGMEPGSFGIIEVKLKKLDEIISN